VGPRKPTSSRRETWVPPSVSKDRGGAEEKPGSRRAGEDKADTDEWLVPGANKSPEARPARKPRRQVAKKAKPKAPASKSKAPRAKPKAPTSKPRAPRSKANPPGPNTELSALRKQVAEADRRAEQAVKREEELREAHEQDLADLREGYERKLAELRDRTGPAEEQRAVDRPKSRRRKAKPRTAKEERLDINTVDFEDLRALGLSVSQSTRLIATRDARMGFDSLKELDDLADLPRDVISTLKQRLRA